jgi:16S rRNA U516 pseudouridylate synthase RsuA-like enzyme
MALYYNLGPLYENCKENPEAIKEKLLVFIEGAPQSLLKMKMGITEKKYKRVKKQLHFIMPFLELLGMDSALEEAHDIKAWVLREGKKKEVKEIFKSFKLHVKNAVKELKKDLSL